MDSGASAWPGLGCQHRSVDRGGLTPYPTGLGALDPENELGRDVWGG